MSRESVRDKKLKDHTALADRINDMLVDFQDEAASVQAKDAFWYAFEYARCNTDAMNI